MNGQRNLFKSLKDCPVRKKPEDYSGEAKVVMQDIESYEQIQDTLALLKILALGTRQIEEGKVQPAEHVLKRLRERRGNC